MLSTKTEINTFMRGLKKRTPYETEFHQAVQGVADYVMPWYLEQKSLRDAQIFERLTEPDRAISFRVSWEKDSGEIRVNRGYRVQFNNTLGPYKGGLRFHPSVNLSILKFLGFEQIFKNSLTGLPMGGAKGGSDFNPKGRSDAEIMRFCQSFMTELSRHIGENIDVPAGDIGVGADEVGYLYGQYKRIKNQWTGVLTGKGPAFGGSAVRKEATGFGCVYFCELMVKHQGKDMNGLTASISGSGNVALYTAQKAIEKGVKVISMSDSSGFIHIKDGLDENQLEAIKILKEQNKGKISEITQQFKQIEFFKGKTPWALKADIAFPCATQNEINQDDAKQLVKNGVSIISEGANMPLTQDAENYIGQTDVLHAPGKASNAGGVAVSGLEQAQNSMRLVWSKEKVDDELQSIMKSIHEKCVDFGQEKDTVDYVKGANLAGFEKVAKALYSQGIL